MEITKVSQLTGKTHTFDLPITSEQIDKWKNGTPIQKVMPQLTPAQREFLMTGSTEDEWEMFFGTEEE